MDYYEYTIPDSTFESAFKKTPDGYLRPLPSTITEYFNHSRGTGPDLYVIKHYRESEAKEIARGHIPAGIVDNLDVLLEKQSELVAELDHSVEGAKKYITTPERIFQNRNGDYSVVFVPCKDGLIACGWYDHAGTAKKGLKLAAFMLYAIGIMNVRYDPVLWNATYRYLPYDSELGRADIADRIILGTMKEMLEKINKA